jgi:hypothetical protein
MIFWESELYAMDEEKIASHIREGLTGSRKYEKKIDEWK